MSEQIQITPTRIEEAVHTITHHAFAQDEAQREQSNAAYWHAIELQVRFVLEGMLFDEEQSQ